MSFVQTNPFFHASPAVRDLRDGQSSEPATAYRVSPAPRRIKRRAHPAHLTGRVNLSRFAIAVSAFVVLASLLALLLAGLQAQVVTPIARTGGAPGGSVRTATTEMKPGRPDSSDAAPTSALPAWVPRKGSASWVPMLLGTQVNFITQHLARSTAPYLGPNSLEPRSDTQTSQAYGVTLVPFADSSKLGNGGFCGPAFLTACDEFVRGQVPERAVRKSVVIVVPPRVELRSRVGQ